MPQRIFDELKNWFNGVNTSAAADMLPEGFSPRARNTNLLLFGEDTARIGKRRGATTFNSTPVTGSPAVTGFHFKKKDGTKYNLLVSNTGRIDKLNTDGTTTVINATGFTSGTHYPNFAVANDLCFICTDVDQKKFDGTTLWNFGIVRPAAPTAVAGAGGAAGMLGSYDFALTYLNNNTGHESSLSDFTNVTVAAGQKVTVSWAAPADAQVTHVRVWIRKQALGPNTFRNIASAVPAPDATTGGYLVATTSTVIDIADATINAYIILAPTIAENNPPAAGLQYPTFHQSRMFLADNGNIYYSQLRVNAPFPESFDPANIQPVNPNDGDSIVGMFSMWNRLYIFKRFSVWMLEGADPNSWTLTLVSSNHGAASQRSIKSAAGVMFWWSGVVGPVAFDGNGQPVNIAKQFVEATVASDQVNYSALATVACVVDEANTIVMWSYPELNSTRNTKILPFNYRAKRFVAEFWNPFDVYGMWQVEDDTNLQSVYMGGYAGQVFKWWAATNDGVPATTTSTGAVTSATSTTVTAAAAAFATAGGGLVDRYAYLCNSDRSVTQRRRITANTATQLTVTPAWDTIPNNTYTFALGAPQFELDTPWIASGDIFLKKRYEFFFGEFTSGDLNVTVDIDFFVSMDDTAPRRTITVSLSGTGGLYDAATSIYGTTKFGNNAVTFAKKRMALVGKAWKARIRNCMPDQEVVVHKLAAQSMPLAIHN